MLFAVLFLAAGCNAPHPTTSPSPSSPRELGVLRTVPDISAPPDVAIVCAGVGLDGYLAGDAHDPRVAWLENRITTGRIEIVFPPHFSARFSPRLEILNANGVVVAREGDHFDGGCVTGLSADSPLLVLWP